MREILFRGKTKSGMWVYGYYMLALIHGEKTLVIAPLTTHMYVTLDKERYIVDPETVGQYTGLTNKDGKKLFEGDIIQYQNTNGNIINPLEVIIFKENGWRAKPTKSDITYELTTNSAKHYNIVGNIYDNVELIRKELYE